MQLLDLEKLQYYDGKIKTYFAKTYASLASPSFTGTPTSTTPSAGDSSTKIATTKYVQTELGTAKVASAGEFTAAKSVTLTGDVTGTASSKGGWSIAATLASSGVTADTYGPSANASPAHSGTFTVPKITVDAKGRVTSASNITITLPASGNVDTKVTQTVTANTDEGKYPILAKNVTATATITDTSRFVDGITIQPSTGAIQATKFIGALEGNASTATKLATARNINGTSFNGTSAITTANWGTARNISISDADGTNTGDATSVNGSAAVTLKLPSTIKASLEGNASSADSVPWSGIDGKPSTFTPSSHNQASSTINAMTGYSKPSSTSAIGTSDTLNAAIGKLEKALDGKQASGSYAAATHSHTGSEVVLTGYAKASSTAAVAATDTTNVAIGKLEKALDGKAASSHGTHVTYSTSNPLVAGTASPGSANNVSRGDHVHPEQTVVKQTKGVFLVIPNETAQTATLTATVDGITEYFPGLTIAYRAPFNTAASSTLNINSLGAKPIYYKVNTASKDYYPANTLVLLVYETTTASGGCWKMVYSYDGNNNNYDRRLHNNAVKAAAAVTAGTVIVGTSAGYKTAASGVTFDIQYPVLYASAAIASAATATNTYEAIPSINLQTTKASWTGTQYATVYLVGTLSGTTVTIDSSIFTTTVPSSADGKVYIPIGVLYSTYQVYFAPTRDIYQYTNGSFHPLDTTTAATGGSNGTIKINGTDVAVKGLGSAAYTASTAYAASSHNQASSTINAMTGYSKPSSTSAIGTSDTLNAAIGKLEKALDGKQASGSYATASHNHDASNINSGTLDAARIPNLDASKITSGTIDIARLPAGALERLVTVADQTARFALTSSNVQLGDTVKQTDTGLMYYVVDTSKLNSADGYVEYTAGAATSVPWSGVTSKPSTFTPSAHNQASNTINAMTGYSKPSSTSAIGTSDTLNAAIGKLEKALDGKAASATTLAGYSISDAKIASGTITLGSSTITPLTSSSSLNAAKLTGTASVNTTGKATTAGTADQVASSLTLKLKSGTTEGTDLYTFNGSGAKTLDIKQGTNVTLTAAEGSLTIAAKDTVYTHPTTSGSKHIPSGGSSGQFLGWDSDGTAKWVANPNSDTKNTAGSTDTSSKIFLVGATSQAANPQTYSHDTAYVGTDGCLYSGGAKVLTAHQTLPTLSYTESGSGNAITGISVSNHAITATKGATYITSSGSITGNAGTATKFASSQSVALTGAITGTASSQAGWSVGTIWRSCMVGQSGSTTTNPWYKVATFAVANANDDIIATFLVEDTYSSHKQGILKVHVRTDGSKVISSTASDLIWLSHTGFTLADFVLVCPTAASSTVELWTKIATGYMYRRFTVLSEGSRSSTSIRWTLLNAASAGQAESITTTGTQIASTFTGQAASCTGNAATATEFSATKSVALTGDVTGSASSKAGWSIATTLANSGVAAGSYGPSANATPAYGAAFNVPYITVDAKGRVTAASTKTVTIPAADNTDTKNTAGSTDTSSKIFLIGATSQAANPQTYSHDTAYVGTDGCLYSGGTKVLTAHQSLANYLPLSGGTVTGTLVLSRNQDADPAADSKPALIVGGASTAAHIEIDANEVMAKGSGTTTAALYLNAGGGDIYLGGNTANYKSVTGRGKGSSTLPVYTDADGIVTACGTSLGVSITGNAATVTGTAGTSALSWNTETTLYTVGGNAIKAKLPSNPNTDVKVKQYEGTTNTERPILSRYSADEATQTANYVVYDTGVTSNPNKHTLTASGGFLGKLTGTPAGTTYVAAATAGNALVTSNATAFGALFNAPTKNYRVALSTWPSNGDGVILYSVSKDNVTAGTNTTNKSLTWNADTGTLTATAFSGPLTGNVTGNVSGSSGSCTGNAATATKLATARTINGTSFDGSAAITTANWGTARDIKIQDSDGTNTGSAVSVNGSAAATLKLPATIKASITGNVSGSSGSCTGNAATATKLATARTINGVSFDGSANITVADSTKLPLAGGTMTGNITMSASKSVVFDLSATTPTASTVRNFPIQFKSQSTAGDFAFAQNPFWEIPATQTANNGMGIGIGAGGLTIIGGGEAGKSIVPEESLTGTSEKVILASDNGIDFFTNCNTVANRVKTSIDTSGNFSGKAANVTGTVAIANGGTGATTRLNALKALTNEDVGSNANYFLTITTSWGKGGYTSVANAKTVLGLKSAAYTESSAYATSGHTHSYLPLAGGTMTGSITLTDKSILFDNSTLDYNAAPSSNITQGGLYWRDKNDKYVARMLYYKNTDKTMGMSFGMCMHGTTNSDGYTTLLGMAMNADGSVKYASCPTPAAADNSTKIATTAFCKDFIKALSISGKTITYTKSTGTTGTLTTQDTTYSAATTDANGLMTKAMVTKLNGITDGAKAYYIKYSGASQITCTASTWKTYTPSSDGAIRILKNQADGDQDCQIRLTSSSGTQIFTAHHCSQFNGGFKWMYLPVKNGVTYALYTTNIDTFKFYFHSRE